MSPTDIMRRLIDLSNGNTNEPEILKEDETGSPLKNFARWGKIDEAAWAGERAYGDDGQGGAISVYQDKDPMGAGEWFWTRSVNGHIVAKGSAPTEEEAHSAANIKEDVLVQPELDETDEDNAAHEKYVIKLVAASGNIFYAGNTAQHRHKFRKSAIILLRRASDEDVLIFDTRQEAKRIAEFFNKKTSPEWHRVLGRDWEIVVEPIEDERIATCQNCGNTDNDGSDICPDCGHDMEDDLEEDLLQVLELEESRGPEVDTVTGPSVWASYLINGDSSGIEPEDVAACDEWQKHIEPWFVVSTVDDDEGRFTWHYRTYGGTADGGTVIDYVVYKDATSESELDEADESPMEDGSGYKQKDGNIIPYNAWHSLGVQERPVDAAISSQWR